MLNMTIKRWERQCVHGVRAMYNNDVLLLLNRSVMFVSNSLLSEEEEEKTKTLFLFDIKRKLARGTHT